MAVMVGSFDKRGSEGVRGQICARCSFPFSSFPTSPFHKSQLTARARLGLKQSYGDDRVHRQRQPPRRQMQI